MISNLLGTKLHQPSPPSKLVQRTSLIHQLTENLEAGHFLTLLSAPAGFGKTSLVSEWSSNLHIPVTWLSLDLTDDDPSQFFAYLIAALQKVNQNIGREIESVLHSGQLPPIPSIVTSLVNDILEADVRFLLILDDFQVIQDPVILEVLGKVLVSPPRQLHLVLITREDPLLPLGRLRANNQMTEIRADDLRFSEREVDLFLNGIMGLSLPQADIAAMESRTEGWAAGLQLAAIAMHDRSDLSGFISHLSGSQRYILGYLSEEVLNRQTEDIQLFLLQTASLDKLCGDLCDAVTGRLDSRAILEKCFHANLFIIPLDEIGYWYRYHHLFRDLLLNQQSHLAKQAVLELHLHASQWYEKSGMMNEAIEHALVAADYPRAVQLLESHAQKMIMQGYLKTVEGWMQALPSESRSLNPRVNLAFAWLYLFRGSYDRVPLYLQQAEQAIRVNGSESAASKQLCAEWLALQATFLNVQGKAEQSIDLANQALQQADENDFYIRSLAYTTLGGCYRFTGNYVRSLEAFQLAIQNSRSGGHLVPEMMAVNGLMVVAIQHGQLHFAYEAGSQALEHLERRGEVYSPMAGGVHASLGLICYKRNELEKATRYLLRGIQLSSLSGHNAGVVYGKTIMGRVFQAQGNPTAAVKSVQEAIDLLSLGYPTWLKIEVASHLFCYYLDEANPAAAHAVLSLLGISIPVPLDLSDPACLPDPLTHQEGLKFLLPLRLLLSRVCEGRELKELQHGIDFAGLLVSRARSENLIEIMLQALVIRARLLAVHGDVEASQADMLQAVDLAEPEDFIRIFLDEGPAIAALLRALLRQRAKPRVRKASFIRQLLTLLDVPGQAGGTGRRSAKRVGVGLEEQLIEPLTDREMDVIRLMAEGSKYGEIAGHLFISLNTVRFYVKEIYSKLNVNNRTQAIEAAHKHNLL